MSSFGRNRLPWFHEAALIKRAYQKPRTAEPAGTALPGYEHRTDEGGGGLIVWAGPESWAFWASSCVAAAVVIAWPRTRRRENPDDRLRRRLVLRQPGQERILVQAAELDGGRSLHQNPLDPQIRFLWREQTLRAGEDAGREECRSVWHRVHSHDHCSLPTRRPGDGGRASDFRVLSLQGQPECGDMRHSPALGEANRGQRQSEL
jgi:hypothetical protein